MADNMIVSSVARSRARVDGSRHRKPGSTAAPGLVGEPKCHTCQYGKVVVSEVAATVAVLGGTAPTGRSIGGHVY